MIEKKEKTIPQALKEIIAGYDVLGNLKFLVMAFFGLPNFNTIEAKMLFSSHRINF